MRLTEHSSQDREAQIEGIPHVIVRLLCRHFDNRVGQHMQKDVAEKTPNSE